MGASDLRRAAKPRIATAAPSKRALGAVLAASLAVGGMVACNQILGTDKYSEGDLVGDASSLDGNAGDGNTVDEGGSKDSGTDVQVIVLPPGAQPSTWAHWKMPDSLNLALDGGGTVPSYAKVTDAGIPGAAIVDLVTKLTWSPSQGNADTFELARDTCKKLGSTWRLPTRIELVSILDHSVKDKSPATPKMDPIFDGVNNTFWTSSPIQPLTNPIQFWKVNFRGTPMNPTPGQIPLPFDNGSSGGYVRCVLGT